jgi:Carboxypeptidase regulatory-like domain/TonB dependent receptor/TonB-dependent Receptor Plug Domain
MKIFILVTLLLVIAGGATGQGSNATLTGRVTDSSKLIIAGANVTLINEGTNIRYEGITNDSGSYYVPELPAGTYRIQVEKQGFKSVIKPDVVLHVQDVLEINFEMAIGSVSETVTVEGGEPQIELASSSLGSVVNSKTVVELPLNGRDWTQLATLEPGVNTIATQDTVGTNANRGNRGNGNELTVSGTRPQANNYTIDGVSVVDYSGGGPGSASGYALGVDAVAEFSVVTSNHSAEYGRTSGGYISAITRSGQNQFHGDAYGFLRSASLDARNYFDGPQVPPFHRSQFGGSLGGPIRKDKTFFFVDYEVFRQGLGTTHIDKVPSLDSRNGIIHNSDGTTTTVIVDPAAAQYLNFWPLPNGAPLGNGQTARFSVVTNDSVHDNFVTTRIDHRFSDKDSLSGTYLFDTAFSNSPDALANVQYGNDSSRTTIALQETHIFSPSVTNAVRFGFSRVTTLDQLTLSAINPLAATIGLGAFPNTPASSVAVTGLTTFNGGIGGAVNPTLGEITAPQHYWNSFQFYDDAFVVRGNHSIKFGASLERVQHNIHFSQKSNGTFTFSSLENFLTNLPSTFQGSPSGLVKSGFRQDIFGAYVQDDWRILPNLTLNLGLRYEMASIPTEVDNHLVNLRTLTAPAPFLGSPLIQNPTKLNFEPRVGLAWDPFGNGKTAIRAAFGIFDVLPLTNEFYIQQTQSAPYNLLITANNLPAGVFPGGVADLSTDPTKLQTTWIQPDPSRNYIMIWNLNVQRQINSSTSATVGYVGHHGVHMYNREDDINTVLPTDTQYGLLFPFPAGSGTRLNPNVGDIRGSYWGGTSLYDALVASVTKRLGHGIQGQAAYTWGKGIDTGSATDIGDPFTNSIASPFNFWPGRRGLSDYNIAQTFVLNFIWNVPMPKDWNGVLAAVTSGWQLGGILTVQTGQPFTPNIGGDPLGLNSNDPWDFPNRVPGCKTVNPGNPAQYINLSCFTLPALPAGADPAIVAQCTPFATSPGTCQNLLGNLGRNSIIGPGLVNLDFSVFKNVPVRRISETFNLQFRTEFFNILNHPNFLAPIDNQTLFGQSGAPVGGAGAIDATSVPSREIQFGLKVTF